MAVSPCRVHRLEAGGNPVCTRFPARGVTQLQSYTFSSKGRTVSFFMNPSYPLDFPHHFIT